MGGLSSKQQFELVLNKLATEDVDQEANEFWDELWKTSLNVTEIFEIAKPEIIRAIIQNKPNNMHALFSQAVAQTFQVVETPYPVYFDQALNCTRVLARILPFIIECSDRKIKNMCWAAVAVPNPSSSDIDVKGNSDDEEDAEDANANGDAQISTNPTSEAETETQGESKEAIATGEGKKEMGFVQDQGQGAVVDGVTPIENKNMDRVRTDSDGSGSGINSNSNADSETRTQEPLAVVLVNSIFHMLFLPDFTIEDPNVDFREEDIKSKEFKAALMWAPGVGCSEKSVTFSSQYDNNRIEVLRVLLTACCDPLYRPPNRFDPCASMWLEVATSNDTPYSEIVLYSLMNTVLGYDPVGWGMPYGNLVSTDTAELLMEAAVQVLVVLLDYGFPISNNGNSNGGGTTAGAVDKVDKVSSKTFSSSLPTVRADDTESPGFNVFRRVLSTIEDPAQLNFIFRGFVRLLNNIPQSDRSYLPFSHNRVTCEQELLVLLWKCLEEIPRFLPYILRHCEVTQLLVPICYFMLQGRRDPARIGLVYLCTFTLLKLSGERNFGVALNKEYILELPVDVPLFSGTHADLLIVMLHKLVMDGHEKLTTLHNCFLTIICNVSPYCKSLNTSTSVKLCNLVSHFASPRRMLSSESSYVYVVMLLETLNNILQYQYQGNVHVVYAILRLKTVFEGLAGIDLTSAREAVHGLRSPATDAAAASGTSTGAGSTNVLMGIQAMQRVPGQERDEPSDAPSSPVHERTPTNGNNIASSTDWEPSQAWIDRLRTELPLNTILRLLKHLSPQVDELAANGGKSHQVVLAFIKETTMVGLLPVPHPIVIRKYQPNKYTTLWFSAFLWGVIFVRSRTPPLFDGKAVRLFTVQGEAPV